jgi:shikimate dehydrogenase
LSRNVTGATRVAGVFGYPVRHSWSPIMHNAAFEALGLNYIYVPFSVHPDNLEAAVGGIRAFDLVGVNVTIPHKERVLDFLDWVSDDARRTGSVNTIHNVGGVLKGYSTDGPGLIRALRAAGKSTEGSRAIVLGAGGSARAAAYSLASGGAQVTVLNRTFARGLALSESLNSIFGAGNVSAFALDSREARQAVADADLLVNCTSAGMHPDTESQPIPSEWLHGGLFVYDQIYNPPQTGLLRAAAAIGAKRSNGIGMLVYQGAIAFEIWTGQSPPVDVMEKIVTRGLEQGAAGRNGCVSKGTVV